MTEAGSTNMVSDQRPVSEQNPIPSKTYIADAGDCLCRWVVCIPVDLPGMIAIVVEFRCLERGILTMPGVGSTMAEICPSRTTVTIDSVCGKHDMLDRVYMS